MGNELISLQTHTSLRMAYRRVLGLIRVGLADHSPLRQALFIDILHSACVCVCVFIHFFIVYIYIYIYKHVYIYKYVYIFAPFVVCCVAHPPNTTKGPMWGYPRCGLGAVGAVLEPFCGHLSPKLDKVY